MFIKKLVKPDGRNLRLYSTRPILEEIIAPSASATPINGIPTMRWHPLRGEWVAYASFRQNRTFLPPPEYNPLSRCQEKGFPTELPQGDYEVAVFDNLFPSLLRSADFPANGACEVVVFDENPRGSLGKLSLERIELILEVWGERTFDLASQGLQYVMPFENRGIEVGVTLHHPHGQIYSYPFIPPVPLRELEMQKKYYDEFGKGLLEEMVRQECLHKERLISEKESAVAFIPECARYPYEAWVLPKAPVLHLDKLTRDERRDLALVLKETLLKLDGLWDRPMPYLMVLHQAPTDGLPHREAHLHFEIYPALRTKDRLKYLAGTEIGAGMFANDTLPEEKAKELREVKVDL